jgi:hypothetical protein
MFSAHKTITMKILFKVSAINVRVNTKDNTEFTSISLFKEVKKEINGSVSVGRKYAEHACVSTTLKVDDVFTFDSDVYDMVKQAYTDDVTGVEKFANKIYLRADA